MEYFSYATVVGHANRRPKKHALLYEQAVNKEPGCSRFSIWSCGGEKTKIQIK